MDKDAVIQEMLSGRHGHFLAALAQAWQVADSDNRARLELEFEDKFLKVNEFVQPDCLDVIVDHGRRRFTGSHLRVLVNSDRLDCSDRGYGSGPYALQTCFSNEGIIMDLFDSRGEVIATSARMYDDIVEELFR